MRKNRTYELLIIPDTFQHARNQNETPNGSHTKKKEKKINIRPVFKTRYS